MFPWLNVATPQNTHRWRQAGNIRSVATVTACKDQSCLKENLSPRQRCFDAFRRAGRLRFHDPQSRRSRGRWFGPLAHSMVVVSHGPFYFPGSEIKGGGIFPRPDLTKL